MHRLDKAVGWGRSWGDDPGAGVGFGGFYGLEGCGLGRVPALV